MAPQRSSSTETQDHLRKRVCKACDRCRLKKSKCDGASPCSRCKADNSICVFGERKKSQDKVYPKGYVEMLEQQQSQLVAGLRELYSRLQRGESWPGQPLHETSNGRPLTHDILERLDLLHSPGDTSIDHHGFEEDCNRMQQQLIERGAPFHRRRRSVSSESEHGHESSSSSYNDTPPTKSMAFDSPFARNGAPPTPPMHSPFPRQSQLVSSIKQEVPMVSSAFMNASTLDPLGQSRLGWMNDSVLMDEPFEFQQPMFGYDPYGGCERPMMVDPVAMTSADPMMPDWSNSTELDFSNFIQNPIGV